MSFRSEFSISDSVSKIQDLIKDKSNSMSGEIKIEPDEIILFSSKHNILFQGGTPMIPIFKGKFNEKDKTIILSGRFEIDSFCKLVIGILFAAIFITSILHDTVKNN